MFLVKIHIRSVVVPMTYDVPILRHVTSNKTYNFCIFSNLVNSEPIDLKIGTHIDLIYTIYHIKILTNKNNITRMSKFSMATKYHIIKHREFFKTLTAAYHPIILDGFLEIPVHYAQCVRVIKNRRQIKHMISILYRLISKVVHTLIGPIICIMQKTAPIKIT